MPTDDRRTWTWRHAIVKAPLSSTTKWVLAAISFHMDDVGNGCFPAIDQISDETGLSRRTVCQHIDIARRAGWLTVERRGMHGRRWKRNQYRPRWPDDDGASDAPPPSGDHVRRYGERPQQQYRGGDPDDTFGSDAGSPPETWGGDPDDIEVVTQDHRVYKSSQESSHSHSSSQEAQARARASEKDLSVSKYESILTEIAERYSGPVNDLIRPLAETLQIQHALPRELFRTIAEMTASDPPELLRATFLHLARTRSKIIAPANIADALEHCRQEARSAAHRAKTTTTMVSRQLQPAQWAAWKRWAETTGGAAGRPRAERVLAKVVAEARDLCPVPGDWPPAAGPTGVDQQLRAGPGPGRENEVCGTPEKPSSSPVPPAKHVYGTPEKPARSPVPTAKHVCGTPVSPAEDFGGTPGEPAWRKEATDA